MDRIFPFKSEVTSAFQTPNGHHLFDQINGLSDFILNINLPVDSFDPINYYLIFSLKSF
ncbi:hypothetical protein GFO_3626 [Christiangramia forsetii KT0803]|uniref:Uncharacterized protein n=1 Tax=Christiangramia forsetii (strain DSM 17595 / CGMCC 1.15422 / KT0803) TaxID=411154 RepID=A0M7G9_CHRFK|nr:hypothetical protein GFO_3626 [Christiangramia forsetii KT0803]